jgi:hypothetical protein
MTTWFKSKKILENTEPPKEPPKVFDSDEYIKSLQTQTIQKINVLDEKITCLTTKVESLEDKLNRLIESNKLLLDWYSNKDQRDVNHMIRSFNLKKESVPPINFVPSKTNF